MGVPLSVQRQLTTLRKLEESTGSNFPGSNHHPTDRKNWISGLNPEKIHLKQIV
ncbi:hypothetical protein Hanom_Chr15g01365351 [Helianthus anomalus]